LGSKSQDRPTKPGYPADEAWHIPRRVFFRFSTEFIQWAQFADPIICSEAFLEKYPILVKVPLVVVYN